MPNPLRRGIHWIYRHSLRRLMAREAVLWAGVPVARDRRRGDLWLAPLFKTKPPQDDPLYEAGLVSALRELARQGDRVVIVGGGAGVTAVIAARLVGPAGSVTCFEGGREQVATVRQMILRNRVSEWTQVRHAVVGPAIGVYSDTGSARRLSAGDLPACDVLELDCEGSERDILQNLTISPRVIIVESHGMLGSPSSACRDRLVALGYRVKDYGLAEPRKATACEANDIRVLAGVRSG